MKTETTRWTDYLVAEDLAFLRRFVLNSGSLKDTARDYEISYPTVRLRLDRLIAKIRALEESTDRSPFERMLRAVYAEGRVDDATFRELLTAHRRMEEDR